MERAGGFVRGAMRNEIRPTRVVLKAVCLFVLLNLLYGLLEPERGRVSGYNILFPGRTRLPFGVVGDPYTVTVDDVDAMFASHRIAVRRAVNEYRVVLIGDSSIWGEGLSASEAISEQWNRMGFGCGDRTIRTYNLGYPHPSVLKDLVILDKALEYEPDLVIWFVTLNTLISQRMNPFLVTNRGRTVNVLDSYDISFKQEGNLTGREPNFLERTLIGQRSNIARGIKLQLLGFIWMATGADSNTPGGDPSRDYAFDDDPRYRGMEPPQDISSLLLYSALSAGQDMAGSTPVLMVNEPTFIAPGADTMVRYNAVYPRWAYDQYRAAMADQAHSAGWNYLDLWNAIPPRYFLDASLHLGAEGERLLIEKINPAVLAAACNQIP